jgi:hypothetical protein
VPVPPPSLLTWEEEDDDDKGEAPAPNTAPACDCCCSCCSPCAPAMKPRSRPVSACSFGVFCGCVSETRKRHVMCTHTHRNTHIHTHTHGNTHIHTHKTETRLHPPGIAAPTAPIPPARTRVGPVPAPSEAANPTPLGRSTACLFFVVRSFVSGCVFAVKGTGGHVSRLASHQMKCPTPKPNQHTPHTPHTQHHH